MYRFIDLNKGREKPVNLLQVLYHYPDIYPVKRSNTLKNKIKRVSSIENIFKGRNDNQIKIIRL